MNGTLTGPVWTSNSVNTSAQELITGDLDRDGYPELAVIHFGGGRTEIFKNRSGVLDTTPTWLYIAGSSATSISFGDVNGDGALDLAVGTARTPVVVFINQLTIPVELVSFTASINVNEVRLNWSTATETNNRGFEIERSPSLITSQTLWGIGRRLVLSRALELLLSLNLIHLLMIFLLLLNCLLIGKVLLILFVID